MIFKRIGCVLALVSALFVASVAPSEAACAGDYRGPLDLAVTRLVTAIKANNPSGVLALVGSQGLTIGQEGEPMTAAQLSADFKARKGRYCDFFTCAGKAGFLRPLIMGPGIRKAISTANGNIFAVVTINPGSGTSETELHFRYNAQCKWELTAIGYL